jgi:hypothetical protein
MGRKAAELLSVQQNIVGHLSIEPGQGAKLS